MMGTLPAATVQLDRRYLRYGRVRPSHLFVGGFRAPRTVRPTARPAAARTATARPAAPKPATAKATTSRAATARTTTARATTSRAATAATATPATSSAATATPATAFPATATPATATPATAFAATATPATAVAATAEPATTSAQIAIEGPRRKEIYCCRKISVLYTSVGMLVLGAFCFSVGIIQWRTGAEPGESKLYIGASACFSIILGLSIIAIRCFILHRKLILPAEIVCSRCHNMMKALYNFHDNKFEVLLTEPININTADTPFGPTYATISYDTSQDLTEADLPLDSDSFHEGKLSVLLNRDLSFPNGSGTPSPSNSLSSANVIITGIVIEKQPRPSPETLSPAEPPELLSPTEAPASPSDLSAIGIE